MDDPTRLARPAPTITQTHSDVDIDDLPPAPAPAPGAAPDVAELADTLRYHLHAVEAQVVSLARELTATRGEWAADRALALVTSAITAARASLREVDRFDRRARNRTVIPAT